MEDTLLDVWGSKLSKKKHQAGTQDITKHGGWYGRNVA